MDKIDTDKAHLIFKEMRINRKEGVNKLYNNFYRTIYGISFSILKNKEDSEEVIQNVLVKLLKVDNDKLPTKNELSWIYKVIKNASINYIKSQKKSVSIDEVYYISKEDTEIEHLIDSDRFNRIISGLSNDEKEIVSLKILSELSFNEIAFITKQPEGTVKWKYYKALNTMKTIIGSITMLSISTIVLINTLKQKGFEENVPIYSVVPGALPNEITPEEVVVEQKDWSLLAKIILPIIIMIFAVCIGYFTYNYVKQLKQRKKNNKNKTKN